MIEFHLLKGVAAMLTSSFFLFSGDSEEGYRDINMPYYGKKTLKEAFNMAVKAKGYDIEQVIDVIEMLADSQGFYGRLLEEIMYIEENKPEQYEKFKEIIEKQGFQNPVDVVMFFEQ